MAILDDVKGRLHISNSASDNDLTDTIEAAKQDMSRAGLAVIVDTEPLTRQAIKLYCMADYNYQGQGERWQASYEGLRDSMALSGDYNTAEVQA